MDNADINFDHEVNQLNKFLMILMDDHSCRGMAATYTTILSEEYAALKALASKVIADDDGEMYLDEKVIDNFIDTLDEARQYIAGCIIWE